MPNPPTVPHGIILELNRLLLVLIEQQEMPYRSFLIDFESCLHTAAARGTLGRVESGCLLTLENRNCLEILSHGKIGLKQVT